MITKPSLSVVPWADSGDRIPPDSAYIASGFPRTNDKPTRQTMNWVLNYATNGVQYLTARGIPDWDGTQNYAAGDVVRSAGKFYSATSLANNINRTPAANPTFWSLWYVFQADLNALFLTPSQANAIYLPRSEVSATFATIANVNSIRDNLQQQINSIQTITGRGYLPGAGIAIDVGQDSSTIRNTSPNVQPDWNATTGGGAILNKPTYATVATTGNYNDLINRPVLAAVATTGNYNSLTNLPNIPAPQINSDWNAVSGVAQILNKPPISVVGGFTQFDNNVRVVGEELRCTNVVASNNASFQGGYITVGDVVLSVPQPGWFTINSVLRTYALGCRDGGAAFQNSYFVLRNDRILFIDWVSQGYILVSSDYRLKENVNLITWDALPLLMRLRPVTFDYTDKNNNGPPHADGIKGHLGFIAHEVGDVIPSAVVGVKDAVTAEGKLQPQTLNQWDVVALLTKAMQELSQRVVELEKHEMGNG